MLNLFLQAGQWSWLLLLVSLVVLALAIRTGLRLRNALPEQALLVRQGIQAIRFWGVVAAGLGILGQVSGLYLALGTLPKTTEVSTGILAAGIARSCSSSILGLLLFLAAAIVSLGLRAWYDHTFGSAKVAV